MKFIKSGFTIYEFVVPWTHHPIRHLDRFSRFCRAYGCLVVAEVSTLQQHVELNRQKQQKSESAECMSSGVCCRQQQLLGRPNSSGVTSHRQPRQCRGAQGPKTVKGAQSDPNYVSRPLLDCAPVFHKIITPAYTFPFRTGRYLLSRNLFLILCLPGAQKL